MLEKPHKDPARSARPAPPREFTDAMAWAAWLYFVDDMTQSEVAKTIGVSRVTVIKLLNDAKAAGLVNVQINPTLASRVGTSRALARTYGLNSAFVIPDNPTLPLVDRLGKAGAHLLTEDLASGDVIGVAWGRTVLAAARHVQAKTKLEDLTVVQVSASPNGLSGAFSPELCVSLLANSLNARSVSLLAPAIVSSPELRDMLLSEPSIRNQMDVIRSANKVIFGVGQLDKDATLRTSGLHSEAVIDGLVDNGAVAAILGRFLNIEGAEMTGPNADRMLGLPLDALKTIPKRICIAGGPEKVAAILAALRGGYVTDLVIDFETAETLMALAKEA